MLKKELKMVKMLKDLNTSLIKINSVLNEN